jgi:4-amino-4-deoxy-L-arabinose transferase-like glycosyltransferase
MNQLMPERIRILDCVVILAVGLFTNFYLLGDGPLAGTEGNRALAAHQMVVSGEWLIPHLYDQVYLRKPPLQYWIVAFLEKATGRATPWVWRSVSPVAGALTPLFLYWITTRWFGRFGGVVGGFSCCAMIALWEQNRTGEIDALNTLACVACACLLIDLGWGPRFPSPGVPEEGGSSIWIMLGAALAFAVAMMTKGPAGIAPIIGALLGPAWFNRTWRAMKSPMPWIALALGLIPIAIYGIAVAAEFHAQHTSPDTAGIVEVFQNLVEDRIKNIPDSFRLGPHLFLFSQPVSLLALFALHPALIKRGRNSPNWSEADRLLLRGLLGAILVSFLASEAWGLVHERYSYVWLPLICPVVGAVAAAWKREAFPMLYQRLISEATAYAAAVLTIGVIVLAVLCQIRHAPMLPLIWAAVPLALVVGFIALKGLEINRMSLVGWGFVGLVFLASLVFAPIGVVDRYRRSTLFGAHVLSQKFPPGTTITTGDLVFEKPELFYYAGLNVESYPYQFLDPMDFPDSRWVLFLPSEFVRWQREAPDRIGDFTNVNAGGVDPIFLVWCEKQK